MSRIISCPLGHIPQEGVYWWTAEKLQPRIRTSNIWQYATIGYHPCHRFCRAYGLRDRAARIQTERTNRHDSGSFVIDFESHLETGFQLAVSHGPLCAEPIEGMAYFMESLEIEEAGLQREMCRSLERLFMLNKLIIPQHKVGSGK